MFTQCPECKTIFGFSEEHTQVANGQVRCSQCSHVFVAMAHSMEELPTADNTQPVIETTSVPTSESNEIPEKASMTDEPMVEETPTDSDDDDPFSLFDDANDFMAAISDDFVRPEPSKEENIVFNELGNGSSSTDTHPESEPEPEPVNETPELGKSTIEAAMAEEKIAEPVAAPSAEEDEADNLADEWASMLEEDESTETKPEETEKSAEETTTTETPEPETAEPVVASASEEDEADNLADEWASMLEEEESTETETGTAPTEETPEPDDSTEQETEDLASEWASMLGDDEGTELTTDIEKVEIPDEATSLESADTTDSVTEPSEEVVLAKSTDDEESNELGKNSSLQDFLQSQLEDLDDEPIVNTQEAEALDISLDSLAKQPAEKPSPPPSLEPDSRFFDEIIPSEEKANSGAIMLAWVIGILVSLILLTSQYIYTMRNDLSQIASVRPSVIKFCEFTECSVPLYSNLEQIEFISQDVRSHPKYQNALIVTLVFINKSSFYQAYPVIQFKLSDIEQNPVAGRYFLPTSYLDTNVNIKEGVKPETPIRAIIEINDPGDQAVNFDFSFK